MAVDIVKRNEISEAEIFSKDHRPWGWFESFAIGKGFHVKLVCIKPGAALSLQSNSHRSEHRAFVDGTAKVTIDDQEKLVSEGQSVYVPLRSKHRL